MSKKINYENSRGCLKDVRTNWNPSCCIIGIIIKDVKVPPILTE